LLAPQHCTPPAVVSAQVWSRPAEITATPPLASAIGTLLSPLLLSPQHWTPPAVVSAQV